ncbi:actin-related protein 10-like [Apostichopus japonicus]|uniref:actin-related protein 10-like n=1 Tax=Stichopus japonicus TaxID=307972 RepID=UPI003AB4FC49
MPLFEGLSAGSEKSAVILDIGAAYSKVGFAGEFGPWAFVPSKVRLSKTKKEVRVWDYSSVDELYDILVEFFHVLYFKHLLVNPKDRRVVFCESILCPTQFREMVAKVLFKHYEVPSILFAPSHLVAMFTLGVNTGLVLDAGYSETTVLPICEGIPIIKGIQTVTVGAHAIHRNLAALLQDQATLTVDGEPKPLTSVMSSLPDHVIEDIKVRTCFVTNLERAKSIQQSNLQNDDTKWPPPPSSVDYPLDGGSKLLISGKVREVACEVLFEQDREEKSVSTTILDSIIQCPVDVRKAMAENLVLIGGTVMLPGFAHRLIGELKELLERPYYKERLAISSFKIHSPPCEANYTAWLGGALFGAMEILSYRSLSRDAYKQSGKVPDWCSLDEAVQEAEVVPKERTPFKQLEALRKLSLEKSPASTSTASSTSSSPSVKK